MPTKWKCHQKIIILQTKHRRNHKIIFFKEGNKIKIVTINIPEQYLDCLKTMVDLGYFPSRSEAVRQALKLFLTKEANLVKEIEHDQFKILKERQMDALIGTK